MILHHQEKYFLGKNTSEEKCIRKNAVQEKYISEEMHFRKNIRAECMSGKMQLRKNAIQINSGKMHFCIIKMHCTDGLFCILLDPEVNFWEYIEDDRRTASMFLLGVGCGDARCPERE